MASKTVSIYEYTDHQKFLQDWFDSERIAGQPYSLNWLSEQMGLKSRSYLQRVLKSPEKPLSEAVQEMFIKIMRLSKNEADYFRALVGFIRSEVISEKNEHYATMHRLLMLRQSGVLDAARYEYLTSWYLLALRELACFRDWKGNYKALGDELLPPITESQARKGVELMLKLGILRQEGGFFVQTDMNLETGFDVRSLAVANYHQAILDRAREAVEGQELQEREFGAITFGAPRALFPKLKDKIRASIRDLIEESYKVNGKPEVVYQYSVQLFKMSKGVRK